MSIAFQFGKMKNVLEMGRSDGLHSNILHATKPYS